MGDFNYNGEHALVISGKNTWDTWHIAPASRPHVAPPKVKTEYISVPGADGDLDYTEVLTGSPRFGNREGSWEFLVDSTYQNWVSLYSELLKYLHGKKHKIILVDDPDYYYQGRLTVDNWNTPSSKESVSRVILKYNLEPYKYPIASTSNNDWQWKELFENTIIYGKFNVFTEKARNLINPDSDSKTVTITTSADMTVEFGGMTYYLAAGINSDVLTIQPGDNNMIFKGSGQVTIDFTRGGIL